MCCVCLSCSLTAEQALRHPLFWTTYRKLHLIACVAWYIQQHGANSTGGASRHVATARPAKSASAHTESPASPSQKDDHELEHASASASASASGSGENEMERVHAEMERELERQKSRDRDEARKEHEKKEAKEQGTQAAAQSQVRVARRLLILSAIRCRQSCRQIVCGCAAFHSRIFYQVCSRAWDLH